MNALSTNASTNGSTNASTNANSLKNVVGVANGSRTFTNTELTEQNPAKKSVLLADSGRSGLVVASGKNSKTNYLGEALSEFWESIQDALLDVTALEVNTMVVAEISGRKFVAEDAYFEIMDDLAQKTEEGLRRWHEELLRKSTQLKEKSKVIDQTDEQSVQMLKQELAAYNNELERYNDAEENYRRTEQDLERRRVELLQRASVLDRNNSLEVERYKKDHEIYKKDEASYYRLKASYKSLQKQMEALDVELDTEGNPDFKTEQTRFLRKIWELRGAGIRGDKIYAQTTIQLDGDVINRFRRDLFDEQETPEKTRKAILEIHNQAVDTGEKQWQSLIEFIVGLVANFNPFRRDNS